MRSRCQELFNGYKEKGQKYAALLLDANEEAIHCFIEDFVFKICVNVLKERKKLFQEGGTPEDNARELAYDLYVEFWKNDCRGLKCFNGKNLGELGEFVKTSVGRILTRKSNKKNPPLYTEAGTNPKNRELLNLLHATEEGSRFLRKELGKGCEATSDGSKAMKLAGFVLKALSPGGMSEVQQQVFRGVCVMGETFSTTARCLGISEKEVRDELARSQDSIMKDFWARFQIVSTDAPASEQDSDELTIKETLPDPSERHRRASEDEERSNSIQKLLQMVETSILPRLTPRQRVMFKLRYFLNKSPKDISEELETTVNNVNATLAQARTRVLEIIDRELLERIRETLNDDA